eukprot:TRINITY_DN244_c0_g1_i3.p1 TRINITY_DN244_c0_g1~~TRINITY_DN244_c0_g1_i3.p1  ORF type:complete len:481 (+),score=137.42 TRINITY_DN244_c0_g1_i3:81-1523(+)
MKAIFLVIALLSISLSLTSDVLVLTADNYEEVINGNEFVLVEFYAPWCGHCKRLEPEYEKAAKELKEEGSAIKLAKVDATIESELASSHGIQGYPTLKFYRNGQASKYDGPREAAGIKTWLKKKSGPPASDLQSKEDIDKFVSVGSRVIGFFATGESQDFLSAATSEALEDFEFGIVSDASLAAEVGASVPSIRVITEDNHFDSANVASVQDIIDFVVSKGYPLIGEFGQALFQRAQKSQVPLVTVFLKDDSEKNIDILKEAAKQYEGKALFAAPVGDNHIRIASQWGASGNVFPTVIFIDLRPDVQSTKPIAFHEDRQYNVENVKSFIEGCFAGTENGFRKSEPVPETQGPVTTVVGSTFEEIVFSDKNDVFIEFYAPWCGHCKHLAPVWEQLGEKFESIPNVVIAKIDATANGFPSNLPVRGFPTLLFFKAGDQTPIPFSGGDRSLSSLADFVVQHASNKIDLPQADDDEDDDDKDEL